MHWQAAFGMGSFAALPEKPAGGCLFRQQSPRDFNAL
jgi:hypothetical protein